MNQVAFNTIIKYGDSNATIMLAEILQLKHLLQVSYTTYNNDDIYKFFTESCSWERPVATLFTTGHPLTMAFHFFDKHLVFANESDMIRCVVT